MKFLTVFSLFISFSSWAEIELLIVGDSTQPIQFVALPFEYQGDGLSPAVTVENHMIQALSSTGLFSMPLRYEQPTDVTNMLAWQFAGIRYVLNGEIYENKDNLHLKLIITDTLTQKPTLSAVILNPDQLELSAQLFADQVYRSLFYTTFTNDEEKQYLNNEDPTLTRYLNQLVILFKNTWNDNKVDGACSVELQQMPGGVPFKSKLKEDCFQKTQLAEEVKQVLDQIGTLPYDRFQEVFDKNLSIQFVSMN